MDYELALCGQTDPELFFPVQSKGYNIVESYREAKKICAVCPLKTECLEEALTKKVRVSDGYEMFVSGVWGGTTEQERREIRKQRKIR